VVAGLGVVSDGFLDLYQVLDHVERRPAVQGWTESELLGGQSIRNRHQLLPAAIDLRQQPALLVAHEASRLGGRAVGIEG